MLKHIGRSIALRVNFCNIVLHQILYAPYSTIVLLLYYFILKLEILILYS